MATERIGIRHLYDSIGCKLSNRPELDLSFPIGNKFHAQLYMGPKPKFGIFLETTDKYCVPGSVAMPGTFSYEADASKSKHPRNFFTEIAVFTEIEVPDDVSEAFHKGENAAFEKLYKLALPRADEFKNIINIVAGIVGLRFHRQFVLELLNENYVGLREPTPMINHAGASVEMLEDISLNERGVELIENMFPAIGTANMELLSSVGTVLGWLMRSWRERTTINKFVSLFIPLECVLQGYGKGLPQESRRKAKDIRKILRAHAGKQRGELLEFFNKLCERQRPSLETRFIEMAKEAAFVGWEADIEAFSRFNRTRNALLHRGDPAVSIHISVGEEEVRTLEDLVERYLNYAVFRDEAVYKSQWRPKRQQQS